MLNVGTLVQPTTKAQYTAKSVPLPPKLFSHNDQQSVWQSSAPEGATSGWGGRMGDLFAAGNGNATFTCVNVSGNAVFLSGSSAVQYQVSSSGPVAFSGLAAPLFGSSACSSALQALVTAPRTHLFENEYTRVAARSIDAGAALTAALATAPTIATPFPAGNSLADQLKFVARMISTAATHGHQAPGLLRLDRRLRHPRRPGHGASGLADARSPTRSPRSRRRRSSSAWPARSRPSPPRTSAAP